MTSCSWPEDAYLTKLWGSSNVAKCFPWVACNLSNSFQVSYLASLVTTAYFCIMQSSLRIVLAEQSLHYCPTQTAMVLSLHIADGPVGDCPHSVWFTRAEMPKSKVSWMALCTDLRKQCGASTKHAPLPYWQQWTETGGQTCWMTGWRCLHSFICWPHCRAHELLVFFPPLDNWGETVHFLNSFTLILIHLAIWCCIISWHGGFIISIFFWMRLLSLVHCFLYRTHFLPKKNDEVWLFLTKRHILWK